MKIPPINYSNFRYSDGGNLEIPPATHVIFKFERPPSTNDIWGWIDRNVLLRVRPLPAPPLTPHTGYFDQRERRIRTLDRRTLLSARTRGLEIGKEHRTSNIGTFPNKHDRRWRREEEGGPLRLGPDELKDPVLWFLHLIFRSSSHILIVATIWTLSFGSAFLSSLPHIGPLSY